MPVLTNRAKRELTQQFLVTIAGYQQSVSWTEIDPVTPLSLLGFKSGAERARTLRSCLQKLMPADAKQEIALTDITKSGQTVAGLIALALAKAALVTKAPSGPEWIKEIADLQEAGA